MNSLKKIGFAIALYATTFTGCTTEEYRINGNEVIKHKSDYWTDENTITENQKDGDVIKFYCDEKFTKLEYFKINGERGNKDKNITNYAKLWDESEKRLDYLLNSIDSIKKAENDSLIKALKD